MQETKKTVAVLFGGKSPEHEVSIITGVQVLNNIDKNIYNPVPIYIAKDGRWYYNESFLKIETFKDLESLPMTSEEVYLPANPNNKYLLGTKSNLIGKRLKIKVDVLFPCFHGGLGENGAFQGLFEIVEKPYVGSEVLGSALGMDKVICKDVFKANGIPTASYIYFYKEAITNDLEKVVHELERLFRYPMFVKPAVGGSSVGITKAKDRDTLIQGLELAAMFDSKVIIEEGIEGAKEINISVLGNSTEQVIVSACEEVFHKGDFLNYDDKYKGGDGKSQGMASTKRQIPADIGKEALELVQVTAKKAFSCLNCFGLIRVDFLVKDNPLEVNIIEVNTIPGSLAFYLWDASQIKFPTMLTKLIELAEKRFQEKISKTSTFSTNILQDFKAGLKNPKLG
mgnify:CR=1 FL=1